MPENSYAEHLRLFELDDEPTPAEQVDACIEEYSELFVFTSEAWSAAIEGEKNSLALLNDRLAVEAGQQEERNARPKQEGWRIFETHMMGGRNSNDLTELTDRMAYAKKVTDQYCEEAIAMLGDRFRVGGRLGNRILKSAEEVQTLQHAVLTQAQVACAYGRAFFAQTESKRRLAQLAENPQTAEALLERIKKEVERPNPTPGLLEIIATDMTQDPTTSTVQVALATKYADTPQRRVHVLQEWLASDQPPRRLQQETVAVILFAQCTSINTSIGSSADTTAIERFAQNFSYWHPKLQSDYKEAIQSQKTADFKGFAKLLDQYIRRSRLPETRAFRKPKK